MLVALNRAKLAFKLGTYALKEFVEVTRTSARRGDSGRAPMRLIHRHYWFSEWCLLRCDVDGGFLCGIYRSGYDGIKKS